MTYYALPQSAAQRGDVLAVQSSLRTALNTAHAIKMQAENMDSSQITALYGWNGTKTDFEAMIYDIIRTLETPPISMILSQVGPTF